MNHFRVCLHGETYTIYDLGSSSGTLVNGAACEKKELSQDDVIKAGDIELKFSWVDAAAQGRLASCAPVSDSKAEEEALADDAESKPVVSHGQYAYLRVIEGEEKGRNFRLIGKVKFILGRSAKSDLRLKDCKVSRAHCEIQKVGDHYIICDNDSANGTFVNGEPVKKTVLNEGDYIRLGYSILKFGWWDGIGEL
jgi:pSer/pThr/pTyr-binding forkhead associated (FHA) protein